MVYASRCDGTCILQVLFGKRTTLRVRTCILQVLFGERTTLRVRTACTLSKCSGPRRQLADIYFGRRCRRPQLFCSSPWPGGFSHYCSTGLADHRVRDRQGRGVKMLQAAHHQQPPTTTRWRASPVWSTPACSLVRTRAAALPAPITLRCIWPSSHLTVTPPESQCVASRSTRARAAFKRGEDGRDGGGATSEVPAPRLAGTSGRQDEEHLGDVNLARDA